MKVLEVLKMFINYASNMKTICKLLAIPGGQR